MVTIVFIILQIFFAMCAVLKIGIYSRIFLSFSWGIFGHVTRLDQTRASKKISMMDYNACYPTKECCITIFIENTLANTINLRVNKVYGLIE